MNKTKRYAALSDEQLQAVHAACETFEQALRSEEPTRIEDCLTAVAEEIRTALFRELLAIELEHVAELARVPENPSRNSGEFRYKYHARFPDRLDDIERVFQEISGTSNTLAAGDLSEKTGRTEPERGPLSVPGYRVLHEIARGGMGRVLAAFDLSLDRDVALKILLPGANANRFVRESKITARLPHPGIPPVYALGTLDDGSPFLAMKLIAGQTLANEMKTADRPRLLQAFTQVCQAVGFAHSRGVIHRDLKPANVMVGAFGEVQVMDWGLAKELRIADCGLRIEDDSVNPKSEIRNPKSEETQEGQVMGTPAYMAPEQARGEAADARADVFALGSILCAILTGEPPYRGKSAVEIIQRAGAADLSEASARLAGCGADAELVALCRRCLSPNPADRPADGQAVADRLTAYLNGVQERLQAVEREHAVSLARVAEQRKRRRVQLALAAVTVLLLLGGGAFAWWQDRQTTERRVEARNKEQQARQGVDADLKLAAELRKQYKFKVAEAALDQAAVLAKEGAQNRLADVEQARHDLTFVVRLDEIHYRKSMWFPGEDGKGTLDPRFAAPKYRQAFAERDLDLSTLAPAEAAKRIAASAVKAELVAAVDDWALNETEPGLRDRLLEVARLADPGPWTDRLRDPATWTDEGALTKLEQDSDPARASAATLIMLAELMRRQGLNPALLLTAARTDYPADFGLAFELGMWQLFYRPDDKLAVGPYEAARALRPDNMIAWHNLGMALKYQGQVDEAIACLRQAIELEPKFAIAHYNLGWVLKGQGQVDEAIACFRQSIELDPKEAKAHQNLAGALVLKGQVDEAIACFQTAIELDPRDAKAHFSLSIVLQRKGRVDEAITCLLQAIEIDPKAKDVHYNLGNLLQPLGKLDEAITAFREEIRLHPDHAQAHCNLGGALRSQGNFAGALEMFRRGHELGSRTPDWRYPSAQWVADAERGLALAERLPALHRGEYKPKSNGERLTFARIASFQKQFALATRLYAEALASDPKLGENRQRQFRFHAACSAALAASGHDPEAAKLDDAAKATLRHQALDWLKAELTAWGKHLESGPPQALPLTVQTLSHWQQVSDLTGIRDKASLDKLPAEEQQAFTQFWADVAALRKQAETMATKEIKK